MLLFYVSKLSSIFKCCYFAVVIVVALVVEYFITIVVVVAKLTLVFVVAGFQLELLIWLLSLIFIEIKFF